MKRILPPLYVISSEKFVIFISILLGSPLLEGQSIDRDRIYRNSEELLILEQTVIAAEKYH